MNSEKDIFKSPSTIILYFREYFQLLRRFIKHLKQRSSQSMATIRQKYSDRFGLYFRDSPIRFSSSCLFENLIKHYLSCLVFLSKLVISILFLNLYQYLSSHHQSSNGSSETQKQKARSGGNQMSETGGNGNLQKPERESPYRATSSTQPGDWLQKKCCWVSEYVSSTSQWISSYRVDKIFFNKLAERKLQTWVFFIQETSGLNFRQFCGNHLHNSVARYKRLLFYE